MTNPKFAIALLLVVVVIAGFSLAGEWSKCRQTHGADYSCFPPNNPRTGRWGVSIYPHQ